MSHDEYWKAVWTKAHDRLHNLFKDCKTKLCDLVGDDNGIDSYHDAKKVLAFVYERHHHATADEMACATLSVVEALQSLHELHEHAEVKPAGVAVR